MKSLHSIRREYKKKQLISSDLCQNPIEQFSIWFNIYKKHSPIDPSAMILATVDAFQQPWQRVLLLKSFDQKGFVFYSRQLSNKGQQLKNNQKASIHFYWDITEQQISIQGTVEHVSYDESVRYFHSRPKESQLSSLASNQSQPIEKKSVLMDQYHHLKRLLCKDTVPVPSDWCGYRLKPTRIEFWQGGQYRLHDRFEYTKKEPNHWMIQRLSP